MDRAKHKGHKNPKVKGSKYERQVCVKLSLWVSNLTRRDIFWRSAMSGGRSTVQRGKGQIHETAGDICATHKSGHALTSLFVVEAKFYQDLGLDKFWFGTKPKVRGFWKKLRSECDGSREPLLVLHQNRRTEIVCTTERGLRLLGMGGRIRPHVVIPRIDMHVIFLSDMMTLNFKGIRKSADLRAIRTELE